MWLSEQKEIEKIDSKLVEIESEIDEPFEIVKALAENHPYFVSKWNVTFLPSQYFIKNKLLLEKYYSTTYSNYKSDLIEKIKQYL